MEKHTEKADIESSFLNEILNANFVQVDKGIDFNPAPTLSEEDEKEYKRLFASAHNKMIDESCNNPIKLVELKK